MTTEDTQGTELFVLGEDAEFFPACIAAEPSSKEVVLLPCTGPEAFGSVSALASDRVPDVIHDLE